MGVGDVALAFGLCSCCFQACGGVGGLGGGLVTSRLCSVYVLLWVPDVFVLFSKLGGWGGLGGVLNSAFVSALCS